MHLPWVNGRELSIDEWNLSYATNGATLRAACKGEGLSVSGTNAQRSNDQYLWMRPEEVA
jgi:hypothetical protein